MHLLTLYVLAWGMFHFHAHPEHMGDLHANHNPCQICCFSRTAGKMDLHVLGQNSFIPHWSSMGEFVESKLTFFHQTSYSHSARSPPQ